VQALVQMELTQKLKDIFVRFKNGLEIYMFPEFITITQLDVTKTFFVILIKGMEVNIPVVSKIIGKTIVAPMTITEENEFGIVVKWNDPRILVGPV